MHILYSGLRYENEYFSFKYKSVCVEHLSIKVRHKAYASRWQQV